MKMTPTQRFALILIAIIFGWALFWGWIGRSHAACIARNCHSDHNVEVCECE